MKRVRLAAAVTLAGILYAAPSAAEPVYVERGGQASGAGWLFLDAGDSTCRLATPRHVAGPPERAADTLTVVLADGRRIDAVSPVVPEKTFDVAFYEVRTGSAGRPCTESRLGLENLANVLADTDQAVLVRPARDQTVKIPVRIATRDTDGDAGALFTIQLSGGAKVAQTMSGGTIMAGDIPLGMLTNASKADASKGIALRFDVMRRLFRARQPQMEDAGGPTSSVAEVTLRQGSEAAGAPINRFSAGGALRLQPDRGAAEIEIVLDARTPVTDLRVTIAGQGSEAASIKTAAVTAPGNGAWTFSTPCTKSGEAVVCGIGRPVGALRLKIIAPQPFTIRDLRIR